ncbi:hypothetical protein THRCLA_22418 [Thraustotheca clavata]|uniref:Uncharacterized protein n=1 Tax=Thraustotheca clavata TaxID=74557 RepID=A0A1V9Z1S6_9STRA|nr:hypothetical protein THRCLA_22418 [Thraustotheca clavata]
MPCAICAKQFTLFRRRLVCTTCHAAICKECASDIMKCIHCMEADSGILPSKPTTAPKLLLSYRGHRRTGNKQEKQDGPSRRPSPPSATPRKPRKPWAAALSPRVPNPQEHHDQEEKFAISDFVDQQEQPAPRFLSVRFVRVEPHVEALRAYGPLTNLVHQAAFAANATVASIQLIGQTRVFPVAAYGYNDWSQGIWDHDTLVDSLQATPVPGSSNLQGVGHLACHPWSTKQHVKTFMSIPVIVDDDCCIGTLDLASSEFSVPTQESIEELQSIAESLGPMLFNLMEAWPEPPLAVTSRIQPSSAPPSSMKEAYVMMESLLDMAQQTADVVRSQRSITLQPLTSSEIGVCTI